MGEKKAFKTKLLQTIHFFKNRPTFVALLISLLLIIAFFMLVADAKHILLENIAPILLALIAITLAIGEFSAQRSIQRERLNFEKEQYDYSYKYMQRIDDLSKKLAPQIAINLQENTAWAADALEQASLIPYGNTLFAHRRKHYYDEKRSISEQFIELFMQRCERLINKPTSAEQSADDKPIFIYLIIDSGTTLYPLFEQLGNYFRKNDHTFWKKHMRIVTNNLPGIESYIEAARLKPSRYSELAVDCFILPGAPLPTYSAIAGKETQAALSRLKTDDSQDRKPYFIGLVTGNFVRIRNNEPRCPLPLARGQEHHDFKVALLDSCDEIYVIAPLGKVTTFKKGEINEEFNFDERNNDPDKKPYLEHNHIDDTKAQTIKLISTRRPTRSILFRHASKIETILNPQINSNTYDYAEEFINNNIAEVPHMFFKFRQIPEDLQEQEEYEFPHDFITERVKKEQFSVGGSS